MIREQQWKDGIIKKKECSWSAMMLSVVATRRGITIDENNFPTRMNMVLGMGIHPPESTKPWVLWSLGNNHKVCLTYIMNTVDGLAHFQMLSFTQQPGWFWSNGRVGRLTFIGTSEHKVLGLIKLNVWIKLHSVTHPAMKGFSHTPYPNKHPEAAVISSRVTSPNLLQWKPHSEAFIFLISHLRPMVTNHKVPACLLPVITGDASWNTKVTFQTKYQTWGLTVPPLVKGCCAGE